MNEEMVTPELYMDDMQMDMDELEMYLEDVPVTYGDTSGITPGSPADVAVVVGITVVWFLFIFGMAAIMIVAFWKIFTKAGEEGWKSIIPFYNTWVLLEISGKPGWWLILMMIPFVNIVIMIMMYNGLSKSFGKGIGYTLGLIFLSPIFFLMLAFSKATYTKPVGEGEGENMPPQKPTSTQTQEIPPQNTKQPNV